jgi:DnaK suppressor protein
VARRKELAEKQLNAYDEILQIKASDDGVHDSLDTTMLEQETGSLVKLRERELKTLKEVDFALERLENGTYGVCEVSGDEISERRLRANPLARLSLEVQEELEQEEKRRNFRPGLFDDM